MPFLRDRYNGVFFYCCAGQTWGAAGLEARRFKRDRKHGASDVGFDSVVNGRAVEIVKD